MRKGKRTKSHGLLSSEPPRTIINRGFIGKMFQSPHRLIGSFFHLLNADGSLRGRHPVGLVIITTVHDRNGYANPKRLLNKLSTISHYFGQRIAPRTSGLNKRNQSKGLVRTGSDQREITRSHLDFAKIECREGLRPGNFWSFCFQVIAVGKPNLKKR